MPKIKCDNEIDTLLNLKNYLNQQLTIIHNEMDLLNKKKEATCVKCDQTFRTKTLLKNHKCPKAKE